MKYLKTFESMNQSYETITEDEFFISIMGNNLNDLQHWLSVIENDDPNHVDNVDRFIRKNIVEFSEEELDDIGKCVSPYICKQFDIKPSSKNGVAIIKDATSPGKMLKISYSKDSTFTQDADRYRSMDIYKNIDEYYFIKDLRSDDYYKCDQFSGLLDCLNDIL